MVLQARSKHRDATPRPPRSTRSLPPPVSRASEVDAGELGSERTPSSPGRRGAAGRKGPRAETAAPAPDSRAGRLAAGLHWVLGLQRGRGRTWSTLLLGEPLSSPLRLFPGRFCLLLTPPRSFRGSAPRILRPAVRPGFYKKHGPEINSCSTGRGRASPRGRDRLLPAATVHSLPLAQPLLRRMVCLVMRAIPGARYTQVSCLRKLPNL